MSVLWWILIGFLIYWMGLMAMSRAGLLPQSVRTQGPIITIHTTRGRALLDRLSSYRRFWRAWGNLGLGIALVIMFGMFLVVINTAIASMFTTEETAITQPQNVLVIPGLNEFLPLSVAPEIIAGLLIGLVVHEGGHGLLCRVEDIDIDSMGVAMFAIIPIGAFVQPEENSQQRADRGGQSRMFAAGVMNNFAITLIAFALLFGLVGTSIAIAPGAGVGNTIDGSAVDVAGIEPGDRITAVDGVTVDNGSALDRVLRENDEQEVTVELADGDTVAVDRSLLIVLAVPDGPAGLETEDRIERVNGEPVHTEAELFERLATERIVTVETAVGEQSTFPAGAHVPYVEDDGPLATAGAPAGDVDAVITAIDDRRIVSTDDAEDMLAATEPGQTVEVEVFELEDGEIPDDPSVYTVELGEHDDGHGYLGVVMQPGITGVSYNDFGAQLYPSEQFLATIGGDTDESSLFGLESFFGKIFSAMVLPIAALLGVGIEQNFAGFTGIVTNFYEVQGSLAPVSGAVFVTANVLFWTGWINLNLGIFNCIPAFPLDGGHLLRASTEAVVSRLPVDNRYVAVKYVTVSIGLAMLAGLVLMIFGQGLLG